MATLSQLSASGDLVRIQARLSPREQEWRRMYAAPSFVEWCKGALKDMSVGRSGGIATPLEQMDDLFRRFATGKPFSVPRQFRKMRCNPEAFVWELKTPSLRIFGWVPQFDHFVCVVADDADTIKENAALYEDYIEQVKRFRSKLDLDEPKLIDSVEVRDVISA